MADQAPSSVVGQPGTLTLHPGVLATKDGKARHVVDFGRLIVPENRARPDSRLIELAFTRIPAQCERPGPPIVFLVGGPGESGTGVAPRISSRLLALARAGDVIALDQRGVGMSRPCLDSPLRWEFPWDEPVTRERYLEHAHEQCKSLTAFWTERGVDLHGYNTEQSADDIDLLRQALGVEQINLLGMSYGSHLGLAVLKRHPDRVARAVLGLVEGPDDTYKLPSNVQEHLEHIAELCAADPAINGVVPDLLDLFESTLERLHAEPITVPGETADDEPVCMSGFDLQDYLADALGNIYRIRELPKSFHGFSRGDFAPLAAYVRKRRQSFLPSAMTLMMDAASGVSRARWQRIQAEASSCLLGDAFNLPFPYVNETLGAVDLGDEFRAPVASDVPTLFFSGTLDGRTPPSNAELALPGFSHGQHVVVEGRSHRYFREIDEISYEFLAGKPVEVSRIETQFSFEPPVVG